MTKKIYLLRQTFDDEDIRPDLVTYYDPDGKFSTEEGFKSYQANRCVEAGDAGYPVESWFVPELYAPQPGTTAIEDWDYYMTAFGFGVFSGRAIDVLTPFFGERFLPLPALLEGRSYFCLHCRSRIDCINKSASEIEYYDFDPQMVMKITKWVFHKQSLVDPMIFGTPELAFDLYCTDSIPNIVDKAGLRGFEFKLIDAGA